MKYLTQTKLLGVFLGLALAQPTSAKSIAFHQNNFTDQLVGFNSCQALENHVKEMIVNHRSAQNRELYDKDDSRPNRFGRLRKNQMPAEPSAIASMDRLQAKSESGAGGQKESRAVRKKGKAKNFTGTNNQIANVDEADFVKFDGQYIYQVYRGQLKVLKAWPANEMNLLSSLDLSGQTREILMSQKTLVAISQQSSKTVASIIDIQNPSSPQLLTKFEVPGNYMSARMVNHSIRIVTRDYSSSLSYHLPVIKKQQKSRWFRALVANTSKEELTGVRLNQILRIQPSVQIGGDSRHNLETLGDCKSIYLPKNFAHGPMTRIVTLDLKAKQFLESIAMINPNTIYASENAIYLAQQGYHYDKEMRSSLQKTAIHRFDIPKGKTARYVASGSVNGHLINQFAMDEHRGYLRVATNGSEYTNKSWWNSQRGRRWTTVNRVQVLRKSGRKLKLYGKTKNLAEGERLYSVRFNGDKGYIVTFRQVDPLFTIDLSNPRYPKMIGELKVPGFSTYIHMLGQKHLLTIGQDADPRTGRPKGLKLSIFDVRDFANPKEVKSLIFNSHASSEASYEHKAFSFYAKKGILAIPVTGNMKSLPDVGGWGIRPVSSGPQSSLLLFKVTTSDIVPSGELNMTDMSLNGKSAVRRSFFADNFVYAIGQNGVKAAEISNPGQPVGSVFYNKMRVSSW